MPLKFENDNFGHELFICGVKIQISKIQNYNIFQYLYTEDLVSLERLMSIS